MFASAGKAVSRGLEATADGSRRVAAAVREQRDELLASTPRLKVAGVRDVHRTRVAARRLRSLLKTFRPLLDERRVRQLRADLRGLAHALAVVREADVRRAMLAELTRGAATITPAGQKRVQSVLDGARRRARAALRRQMKEPGWAARLVAIESGLEVNHLLGDHETGTGAVLRRVERTWREAVILLEQHPRKAAELHALRLALKHCRYALEPVADIAPVAAARLLRRLRAAQDAIGEHRDNELATAWVREDALALGAPLVKRLLAELERREPELLRVAVESSERLLPAQRKWRAATQGISRASKRDRA